MGRHTAEIPIVATPDGPPTSRSHGASRSSVANALLEGGPQTGPVPLRADRAAMDEALAAIRRQHLAAAVDSRQGARAAVVAPSPSRPAPARQPAAPGRVAPAPRSAARVDTRQPASPVAPRTATVRADPAPRPVAAPAPRSASLAGSVTTPPVERATDRLTPVDGWAVGPTPVRAAAPPTESIGVPTTHARSMRTGPVDVAAAVLPIARRRGVSRIAMVVPALIVLGCVGGALVGPSVQRALAAEPGTSTLDPSAAGSLAATPGPAPRSAPPAALRTVPRPLHLRSAMTQGATSTSASASATRSASAAASSSAAAARSSGTSESAAPSSDPTRSSSSPAAPPPSGGTSALRTLLADSGTRNVVLGARAYTMSDFTSALLGVDVTGRLVGAGSGSTIVRMVPHSSTRASSVPKKAWATNQLSLIRIQGATRIAGFTLQATDQDHLYNGLRVSRSSNTAVSDVRVLGVPGGDDIPPGETFGINDFHTAGTTYSDVEVDGAGSGAANFGTNSSSDVTIEDSFFHDSGHANGATFWQTKNVTVRNTRSNDNHDTGFNFERVSGTVLLDHVTMKGNRLAHMRINSDKGSAQFRIVDPVFSGSKLKILMTPKYMGSKNLQKRSDVHVIIGGVDRTDDVVQWVDHF